MNHRMTIRVLLLSLMVLNAVPMVAYAQGGIPGAGGPGVIQNPLGNVNNLGDLLANRIIPGILSFAGLLALLAMIWGGGGIILSFGNEEKMKEGKGVILAGAIGLIVILAAYAILRAVSLLLGLPDPGA